MIENYADVRKAAHYAIESLLKLPEVEDRAKALELLVEIRDFRLNPVAARTARTSQISEQQSLETYVIERCHATGLKRRCYFRGREPLIELAKIDSKYFRKQTKDMIRGVRIIIEGIVLSVFNAEKYTRHTTHDESWTDFRRFETVEIYELKDEKNNELSTFVDTTPMLDYMLAGPWHAG